MGITGIHTLFYTTEVEAFRAAMRDAFEFSVVGERGDWMAFGLPEVATLEPHGFPRSIEIELGDKPSHEVAFVCDDIETTMEQLRANGVEFRGEAEDHGWAIVAIMVLPGGVEATLVQPPETPLS